MKIRSLPLRPWFIIPLLALILGSSRAAEPDLKGPLPVDPTVKMGVLPNGVHYWIRSHKTPPGKVTAWLHLATGSVNEEENQRGLAHFLEHMAFNGSEHFAPGTLVKYFESIGLRFGHDQNAFTSFDQTVYQISLPDPKPETISRGLQFLSDIGGQLLLPQTELDSERHVVLEEVRARKGLQQRIMDKLWPLLLPGSRIGERQPIGKPEVVEAADRNAMLAYYRKWYRPDNATVLFVGDMPVADAEKLIAEAFGSWKDPAPKTPSLDPGIKPYTAPRAAVLTDPEQTEAEVSIVNVAPLEKRLTVGDLRRQLVESIGCWIFNRRMATLVEKGSAPFQSANAGVMPLFNAATLAEAQATGKPEQWAPLLLSLVTELKRAREFGFLAQELNDARKATLASAEQAARTETTSDARVFISRMNRDVSQDQKPLSDPQRLELLRALLPGITLQEINASFQQNFAPQTRLMVVTVPEKAGVKAPTEQELLAAAAKAEAAAVTAQVAEARPESLLEHEPQPGTIRDESEDKDLNILSATLSNGVRVHLRSMDFKKDQVLAQINVGGGAIRETAANHGISQAAALAFDQAATDKLSSTVIREMLTGKNVSVSGNAGDDTLTINIKGSPADLEQGFQLAYLLLTQGRIEETALKHWKDETTQSLEEIKRSAESQTALRVRSLLMNNDPRGNVLTPEEVARGSLDNAQDWLNQTLASGPIEASIVGDIPRARALELALKYLGSLPARTASDDSLRKLRELKRAHGPLEATLRIDTIAPRAVVQCGWRGADWNEVKDRRVLQMAAQILSSRLREEIREKRGLTYSIACFASPGRAYEGTGFIGAWFTADPAKAADACKLTYDVMQKFAQDGPTESEMETVHKQMKNDLETMLKEPSYWSGVLAEMDYRGTKLSDVKELLDKMTSYTRNDVLEVCQKYLRDEDRVQVIAMPKANATGKSQPVKDAPLGK